MNTRFFRRAAAGLTLTLLLSLTACGTPSKPPEPPEPNQTQTTEPEKTEAPSLTQLRDHLMETGDLCAIAFLGHLPDSDQSKLTSLLDENGYTEAYPFLAELEPNQIVSYEGGEVYCLVPRDEAASLTVQEWISNESNHYQGEAGDTLYQSDRGDPVILIGNLNDVIPNLLVTLTGADGATMSYSPSLSMCDGTVDLPVSPGVYDFSLYQTSGTEASTDFLGHWSTEVNGQICSLALMADGTMTYWYGTSEADPQAAWEGTFYVISETAQGNYQPGDVVFELSSTGGQQEQTQDFWGVFRLSPTPDHTLSVTNTGGDPLMPGFEKQEISFSLAAG